MCAITKQYYVMKDQEILNSTLLITNTVNEKRVHFMSMAILDSKVHWTNMGPPGSCRPQMGPMLAPWTLLSGMSHQKSSRDDTIYTRARLQRCRNLLGKGQRSFDKFYFSTKREDVSRLSRIIFAMSVCTRWHKNIMLFLQKTWHLRLRSVGVKYKW